MDIYLKENEKINIYSDKITEFKSEISIDNGILKIMANDDVINIGDVVQVTDFGSSYPTYFDWAKKYVPDNYFWAGGKPENNDLYTVVCKGSHINDNDNTMLYGISSKYNHEIYIINERGIKKTI